MAISKYVIGLPAVLKVFDLAMLAGDVEMGAAAKKAQRLIYDRMIANISLSDHSLQDLRDMGNPYAKSNPQSIHSPEWLVHTHTGDLIRSIQMVDEDETSSGTRVREVGIDEAIAPHAKDIIFGTSTMVARDFITGTFLEVEKEVNEIFAVVVDNITK